MSAAPEPPKITGLDGKVRPVSQVQVMNDLKEPTVNPLTVPEPAKITGLDGKVRPARRTIAEEEGVSEKQVRKDLATSGADGSAPGLQPEQVTGKDGRARPARRTVTRPAGWAGHKTHVHGHAPAPCP